MTVIVIKDGFYDGVAAIARHLSVSHYVKGGKVESGYDDLRRRKPRPSLRVSGPPVKYPASRLADRQDQA